MGTGLPKHVGSGVDINTLYQMVILQQQQIDDQKTKIEALVKNQNQNMDVLNGDPNRDLKGLRTRMKEAEETLDEWKRYKLITKGIAIGMGLTMVTSISTLITVISQVVKVTP